MTKDYALFTALIILLGVGAGGALAGEPGKASLAFVTYLQWDYQEYTAAILVNSIRRWGGAYADSPIYVVLADPERTGFRLKDKNVVFVPLTISDQVRSFPLSTKAFAAAKVEDMTSGKIGTLVWLDPGTIILGPPKEYDLKTGSAAAVAPVHFINTGQAETEAIDAYWGPIYTRCRLDLKKLFTVETFVDCKKVRAWLNCGMFSVRPERGLFREWAKILDEFINDREYQRTAITDRGHRTFLHQAVISTLIVSRLERREIHMLPRGYNYPLYCHDLDFTTLTGDTYKIPPHKRVRTLNELTSVFIESLFAEHADWIKFIPPADEPLKSWLINEYENSLKVVDRIYREENSCNSYLVTSDGGSVLVDPGGAAAPESALRRLSRRWPVQAILLTHAHHDHIEGIADWTKDKDIPVFPNLSTLRGSPARPALEYIKALDKALSLEPEVLLPGHGDPLLGKDNIRRKLTLYRDAVRYVHDAVVRGMNEGKDARTLAQEITLPPELQLPQSFGRVSWSVRGIFEGYAGWFDENPSSMYKLPPSSIDAELVRLCDGADVLARRGLEMLQEPSVTHDGPKVMLINHCSASGGDTFPYNFRKRKLGTLIGTRTWGGLVGQSGNAGLVDGTAIAVATIGIVDTEGGWTVEGEGISPDIEVWDLPELVAQGRDPSVEKAVAFLLEELKKNPPKKPVKPADPDRSKWHEKKSF